MYTKSISIKGISIHIFGKKALTWWQVGILKISVLSAGILVGALWHEVFVPYSGPLLVLALGTGVYSAYVWGK